MLLLQFLCLVELITNMFLKCLVNNGPKEQLSEGVAAGNVSEDFESWRSQQQAQQQQGGGAAHTSYATSVPISSATDPYNMSTAAGKQFKFILNFVLLTLIECYSVLRQWRNFSLSSIWCRGRDMVQRYRPYDISRRIHT